MKPDSIGNENWVRCGFRDCHKCCLETEMILTQEDLARIETAGHNRNDFLLPLDETDNFFFFFFVDSPLGKKCYFLDLQGNCSIYDIAPTGCKLYPLIKNLDTNEVMVDFDCREQEWFKSKEYLQSQIISVHDLVGTLLLENGEI